jgi:hypothetical protein
VIRATIGLALAASLLFLAPTASALQCAEDFQKVAFAAADVVVIGEATKVTARDVSSGVSRVTLRVERPLKGAAGATVDVDAAGFKGGFAFERGRRYLVFARRDDAGVLWVDDCGGTIDLANATEALSLVEAALRKGGGAPPPAVTATPSSTEVPPAPTAPTAPSDSPPLPLPLASSAPPPATAATVAVGPTAPPGEAGCASCSIGASGRAAGASALVAWFVAAGLGRRLSRRR